MNYREVLERFYQSCRNKKITKAAIIGVPYIGRSIFEYVYGGNVEALINKIYSEDVEKQEAILKAINDLLEQEQNQVELPGIVTFGSGTVEYVLKYAGSKMELGNKHRAELKVLYGGSGVNHAMRLLLAGYEAIPIVAVGKDELGKEIQSALADAAKIGGTSHGTIEFINPATPDPFFDPNIHTSSTVIIVHGAQRTIFTQNLRGGEYFLKHIKRRIHDLRNSITKKPCAVMIGHIHSDSAELNKNPGECTKFIVEEFKDETLIFANFGNSQINQGMKFWIDTLPDIDIFQLNLEEAKRFFSNDGEENSLVEIVDIIRNQNITAVITLDKFGAIGIHKDRKESIILAWPLIEVRDIVDSTGAGDAFGAGLVSHLCGKHNFNFFEFQQAIETARTWSGLACKDVGGSGNCPDRRTIEEYKEEIARAGKRPVEVKDKYYSTEILSLIDTAFN